MVNGNGTDLMSLTNILAMRSLALSETSLKCLVGNEYLTVVMLSRVRSRESTRKGECPPRLRRGGREGGR